METVIFFEWPEDVDWPASLYVMAIPNKKNMQSFLEQERK
jgi:hypothetical protein